MTMHTQSKRTLAALVPAIDEVVDGAAPVDTRSHQARVISPVDVDWGPTEPDIRPRRTGPKR